MIPVQESDDECDKIGDLGNARFDANRTVPAMATVNLRVSNRNSRIYEMDSTLGVAQFNRGIED